MFDVSVIIPTINEEVHIKRCLDTIFGMDYPRDKYEVIVVDNGSTDSTASIAELLGATVYQKKDVNISSLRNYGAGMSRGRVLVFVDADCTVDIDWLKEAERYFQRDDVACFGSTPRIPDSPTWVQKTWSLVREKTGEGEEISWLESMNMFVRKDLFNKVGGFNEKLVTCEDVDISYRLSRYGKIISDKRIRAVHHGEARDIKEFFLKEKWRGKGSYKGVLEHGLCINELPSIVLPIYFGLLLFLSVAVYILTGKFRYTAWMLLLWQLPVIVIAFLKIRASFSPILYLRLVLLYNVYYTARLMSVV